MLQVLFNEVIRPLGFPLYCLVLITLVTVFVASVCLAVRDGIERLRRLHQVPCSRCAFYTGDYRLKCTVHPVTALSEEAIHCRDFEQRDLGLAKPQTQPSPCSQSCQERRRKRQFAQRY